MATTQLLELAVDGDQGRLRARHLLRELCRRLGLEPHRGAGIGIALTEVLQSFDGRPVATHFLIESEPDHRALLVRVRAARSAGSAGPAGDAINEPVLAGRFDLSRLVDRLTIHEKDSSDLVVELEALLADAKEEGAGAQPGAEAIIVPGRLNASADVEADDERLAQHEELVALMHELFGREGDMARMSDELEETNRGVLALYAELDEAARQWHTTFDSISDGVCLLDLDGRIMRVNDSMVQLLQRPFAEIAGRPAPAIVRSSLGVLDMPDLMPSVAEGRRRQSVEVQSRDRWFTLTLDTIPAQSDGGVSGAVLIVSDITERKRLEDQRRLAEKQESEAIQLRAHARRMGELERMKSDFLNLASHELRGPLSVLRGYISMLEDGSLGQLTDSMKLVVPVMTSKMREMNMLINQMLETARIEDSRLVLNRERLDLREVLQQARESMMPVASDRHRLQVVPGDRAALVDGDRTRLVTILTNLIDNAIKYSPEGGEVRCELVIRDGLAHVSVSDSGLGIDEADVPRLFTRFGRVVNRDNSHIPGTGLGLYLSRELARMHGGDINVRSRRGAGSTFTLQLPHLAASPPSPPEEAAIVKAEEKGD